MATRTVDGWSPRAPFAGRAQNPAYRPARCPLGLLTWGFAVHTVGLETAGQFADMGHEPSTLLATRIDIPADAFQPA